MKLKYGRLFREAIEDSYINQEVEGNTRDVFNQPHTFMNEAMTNKYGMKLCRNVEIYM